MLISDRDFVQQRKVWKNTPFPHSHIIHFKSVEVPECPHYKGIVRAHTYISGYYIQKVSDSPLESKLIIVAQNDIKGSIPKFIVNSVAAKAPRQWVENLKEGCKRVKQELARDKK